MSHDFFFFERRLRKESRHYPMSELPPLDTVIKCVRLVSLRPLSLQQSVSQHFTPKTGQRVFYSLCPRPICSLVCVSERGRGAVSHSAVSKSLCAHSAVSLELPANLNNFHTQFISSRLEERANLTAAWEDDLGWKVATRQKTTTTKQ